MPSTPLAIFQTVGPLELVLLLAIVAIVFSKRLPALGRQLGSGLRGLKGSLTESKHDDHDRDPEPETLTGEVVREKR